VWMNIRAFVAEKGGGAAFIAGPRYLPWLFQDNADIAGLLPIDLDPMPASQLPADVTRGFSVRPTALGLQSPLLQLADTTEGTEKIWQSLAPQYWLFPAKKLKPAAQVLAEGPASPAINGQGSYPIICFQYVGAGRVLFHAIDSTWRWRLRAGDAYFARYWVQAIRFLARGKLNRGSGTEISVDRHEYKRGEVPQVRVRFLDARSAPSDGRVVVKVETRGRDQRRFELQRNHSVEGAFEGALADLPVGSYQITLTEPTRPGVPPIARFTVVAPPGEFARTEMDSNALAAAAEMTHGKFYRIAEADRLLAELPDGRRVPIENLPPLPIWNRWWMLAAFLACLSTEWILRKRKGMI